MQPCHDAPAALIRGEDVPWAAMNLDAPSLADLCTEEGLTGLVYQRARALPLECVWPEHTLETLARHAFGQSAGERVRGDEIRRVIDALAASGLRPILLKGTGLAYGVYPAPASRPRGDTDLIIPQRDAGRARDIFL